MVSGLPTLIPCPADPYHFGHTGLSKPWLQTDNPQEASWAVTTHWLSLWPLAAEDLLRLSLFLRPCGVGTSPHQLPL